MTRSSASLLMTTRSETTSLLPRLRLMLLALARQGIVVMAGVGIGSSPAVDALFFPQAVQAQSSPPAQSSNSRTITTKLKLGDREIPKNRDGRFEILETNTTESYYVEIFFSIDPEESVTVSGQLPNGLRFITGDSETITSPDSFSKTYNYKRDGWRSGRVSLGLQLYAENNDTIEKTSRKVRLDLDFSGGGYNRTEPIPILFTILDNDELDVSTNSVKIKQGGSATYTVELDKKPAGTVIVTVGEDPTSNGVTVSPSRLTFNTSNWNREQTFTVKASQDHNQPEKVTLNHHVNIGNKNSLSAHSVTVNVDKRGVIISPTELTVKENESKTYTVKLNTPPTGPVTVNLNPDNDAAEVSPRVLTFTTSDWHQAQTVTVNGKEDSSRNGEEVSVTVNHKVAGADYDNVTADPVTVKVIYPLPPLPPVVPVVPVEVVEGDTATYDIPSLLSEPPTETVTVYLSSEDPTIAEVLSPKQFPLSPSDWSFPTVTVGGVDDNFETEDRITHVLYSFRYRNRLVKGRSAKVTVKDNDKRGVTVAPSALTVREGASNTYTVKLNTEPVGGSVTVRPSLPSSSEPAAVSLLPDALTFTTGDWNIPKTVTVAGKNAVNTPVTVSHTVSDADYDNVPESELGKVTVTVEEPTPLLPTPEGLTARVGNRQVILTWDAPNDASITLWQVRYRKVGEERWNTLWKSKPSTPSTPSTLTKTVPGLDNGSEYQFGIQAMNTIGQSQWSQTETATPRIVGGVTLEPKTMTITEGGTGRYTVVLDTRPSEDVGIRLNLEPKGSVEVLPDWLEFNQNDWYTPKTVTVTSVDDDIDTEENTKTVKVRHTVTGYGGVGADDVTVVVTDNDIAGVTVKISKTDPNVKELTIEEGSTYTYEVVLDTQPESRVEVAPVSMNQNVVTVSPGILAFTTDNWNQAQTVTLTGVNNDDVDTGTKTVELIHTVGSGYGNRGKGKPDPVTMTVMDDDRRPPAQPEGLTAKPGNGEVTLTWTNLNDASITLWQVAYFTTGPGRSSDGWEDIIGSKATTTTHTVTGLQNGSEYSFSIRAKNDTGDGKMSATVTATPAVPTTTSKRAIVPSTVRVVEGASGQTKDYVDVLLRERPTDSVKVTAKPLSSGLTVVTSTKTVMPVHWVMGRKAVQILIDVTAVDNHKPGLNSNARLEVTVSGGGYDTVKTVEVEIIDDDTNRLVVSHGDLKLQESESASYEVSLSKRPTAKVTVNIGKPTGDIDLTVTPSRTLTFTTSNWNISQTVTVTADNDIETPSVVTLTHSASGYTNVPGGTVKVELGGGGDSLSGSALTLAEDPDHQDAARAAKARAAELAGTSRALLGMASDMLGARLTGAAAMGGGGGGEASLGDQAWGVVENLLGINGNELPTDLDLEQMGERLWSQSFQITAGGGAAAQAEGISSGGKGSWTLWGAGDLRSYRGDAEEHVSFSGSLKTGWLGLDHRFNEQWLAGLAVSHSSGESDYTYRKVSGATDGGKLSNELTAFYPYGAVQLSERFRLWGLAGFGFGSQRHQPNEGGEKAEGKLRLQMGVVGFTHKLDDVGALQLALAGDVALARSTTDWPSASGLQDVEVSLSRARLGVDTRFPLTEQATGYVNVKGRLDGGELEMGAAEVLAGLHYNGGRFSGALQGQQVYAFDGSYGESGVSAQLRFRSQPDGTGLAWELQPSYGYDAGTFALGGEQVSLWSDEQLASLSGGGDGAEGGGEMELSSRLGYGIRLWDGERLLTPFTELRLGAGGSRSVGLGLSLSTPSWEVELKGASEGGSGRAATGKVDLTFSRKL